MADLFDLPCLNIIWGLVNSSRFRYTDQTLKDQIHLINKEQTEPRRLDPTEFVSILKSEIFFPFCEVKK